MYPFFMIVFFFILSDSIPVEYSSYFCWEHLPWCTKYEIPTYYCGCLYCLQLPREWRKIKGGVCVSCRVEDFVLNRIEQESTSIHIQGMKQVQSTAPNIIMNTGKNVLFILYKLEVYLKLYYNYYYYIFLYNVII